jgi:hypothetical protein
MEPLRERFLKTYANIPLQLRDEIILVFEGDPVTWKVAYLEVKANSPLGEKLLQELNQMQLI